MTRKQDDIYQAATRIIDRVMSQPFHDWKNARRDWLAPPPIASFTNLEPVGFGINESNDWWIFNPEDCPPDLVWPISVGVISEKDDGRFFLTRTRSTSLKEVRGYAKRYSKYMVRMDIAGIFSGALGSAAALYAYIGNGWTDAEDRTLWSGRVAETAIPNQDNAMDANDKMQPRFATAIALRQRYEWAVSLGIEGNAPTVRFATDPTGIKDIFRIRDLPEGRDRRAALMTWITDHWRQDRRDPDIELYVRKHMRGAADFNWRGLRGSVLPSQFDIDTRDRLILEREAMRSAGTDRRQSN